MKNDLLLKRTYCLSHLASHFTLTVKMGKRYLQISWSNYDQMASLWTAWVPYPLLSYHPSLRLKRLWTLMIGLEKVKIYSHGTFITTGKPQQIIRSQTNSQ